MTRSYRVLQASTSGSAGKFRTVYRVIRFDGQLMCECWHKDKAELIRRALQQAESNTRTNINSVKEEPDHG